jgi:hypothetical protein
MGKSQCKKAGLRHAWVHVCMATGDVSVCVTECVDADLARRVGNEREGGCGERVNVDYFVGREQAKQEMKG